MERIKSEKKPTVPVAMSLASQERSVRRELFEQVKKEKQLMLDEIEAKQAKDKAVEEIEEVKRIREQSIFKATPIKHYHISMGKVSPKKLT
jgi:Targeting protein for Xklp2 (TPX2) domain